MVQRATTRLAQAAALAEGCRIRGTVFLPLVIQEGENQSLSPLGSGGEWSGAVAPARYATPLSQR